jgi:hypothetical protein
MPYLDELDTRDLGGGSAELLHKFRYECPDDKEVITCPRGFITDFASIPWYFRWLITGNDNTKKPAVPHDRDYRDKECPRTRYRVDKIFLMGMKENNVPKWKRKLAYRGVRLGGKSSWQTNELEETEETTMQEQEPEQEQEQYENYFTPESDPMLFACPCGNCEVKANPDLIKFLNVVRHKAKVPMYVTSGPRCAAYNAQIEGAKYSEHIDSDGADIQVSASRPRFLIIKAAIESGCVRIGAGNSFLHLGISETNDQEVFWDYY